jgi:hypothetical protein
MAGDKTVELYGVWDGGNQNLQNRPRLRKTFRRKRLLDSDLAFKEQVSTRFTSTPTLRPPNS